MYRVSQTFETLGDPCARMFPRKRQAERYAAQLRRDLAAFVREQCGAPTGGGETGWSSEIAAWNYAAELSAGHESYTPGAASYIAARAVQIEVVP